MLAWILNLDFAASPSDQVATGRLGGLLLMGVGS